MNAGHKILKERMACGQMKNGKIFEMPDEIAFTIDSANIEIGFRWGLVTLSKSDILKMAEIIKCQRKLKEEIE